MLGKILCAVGLHKWADLQRRDADLGQEAVQECERCHKSEGVYRLFWYKDGPMHSRIRREAELSRN